MIIPADYPQLAQICWNRDTATAITEDDAFALYERNWRRVDRARLTDQEAQLIRRLADQHPRNFLDLVEPEMVFRRPHHQRIVGILRRMDAGLLMEQRCFFGGDTALVLKHSEYRLSKNIDFLCSNAAGYATIRELIVRGDVQAVFGVGVRLARDFQCDQHGLRAIVMADGEAVKVEIFCEARIDLDGSIDPETGVPTLSETHLITEKLLANADRGLDALTNSRDLFDLAMALRAAKVFPKQSIALAEQAYRGDVARKLDVGLVRLADVASFRSAASALNMELSIAAAAIDHLGGLCASAWPQLHLTSFIDVLERFTEIPGESPAGP